MAVTYKLFIDWDDDGVFEASEEVTADLLSYSVGRQFPNVAARVAQAGRATFVLNNPISTYTPIVNADALPMLRIRFSMTVAAVERPIFTGRVLMFVPNPRWGWRVCTLECADLTYLLQDAEINIPVQTYVRADELIETAIAAAGYASHQSALSQRAPGIVQISADRWDASVGAFAVSGVSKVTAFSLITQAALSGWGRWFVDGLGEWRYYSRHHKAFGEGTDYTITDNPAGGSQMFLTASAHKMSVDGVKNDVRVGFYQRTIGTTLEVIARTSQGSQLSINPGETRTVTLAYRDPTNVANQIGGLVVNPPEFGVDVLATYEKTGDGPSALSDLVISENLGAQRAELEVTNMSATQVVWIHRLQLRGIIVRMRETQQAIVGDVASMSAYRRRQLQISCSLISQPYEAWRLAQYLLNQFKDPKPETTSVTLNAGQGDTMAAMIRDIELLDGITLNNDRLGYSMDLLVSALTHSGDAQRGHRLTLSLEPIARYRDDAGGLITNPFLIGSPIGNATYDMVY